ncbi:MAG: UDP-2,3-diacylglucosamine diphosphatase [Chlorobi bacterium]|nr:UDP-2,3-diacylglucosamine diphosphatase [Chlorobiota bacterium]
MSISYFISDVHLGFMSLEEERSKEDLLLNLLAEITEKNGDLFILGDLFDFWYEYRHVVPRGFHRTLAALDRLTSSGARVEYLIGNHDFAVGDFFRTELNIPVHRRDLELYLQNKRLYLYHGDGLAASDTGYRFLKRILHNPIAQFVFRWIHPDIGFRLARLSSHTSRNYTGQKDFGPSDGILEEAKKRINDGFDVVIMGHRHVPSFQRIEDGCYINLGAWLDDAPYAVLEHGEIRLRNRTGHDFHL